MRYKIATSVMTLGILSFLVGGSTMAYFKSDVGSELATFTSGTVEVHVQDGQNKSKVSTDFAETRKLEWEITNNGTEDVRFKTKVLESGRDTDQAILLSSGDGWTQGDDGDYYYAEIVEPDVTVTFPLEVKFDTWNTVEDYGINIETQAVQASKEAIDHEWLDHTIED